MLRQLDIKKDSIVYIACPAKSVTGGPELLHQLCDTLTNVGIDARMYYYPNNISNPKPEEYDCYNTPIVSFINDSPENIIIVPEVKTDLLKDYQKLQKVIWWLSVDNFYVSQQQNKVKFLFYRTVNKIAHLFKIPFQIDLSSILNKSYISRFKFNKLLIDDNILHFVQSEYAKEHLLSRNINSKNIYYLSDYLNRDFIKAQNNKVQDLKRENIVLYNPKKGYYFTKKLMEAAPDLQWMPLINLSRSEVINYLQKSKVYIDFGNHPGKDRFPREAAICGCCVITGVKGSAKYHKDVPIPKSYKFEDSEENIYKIIDLIRDCLDNYEQRKNDFEEYRQFIKLEEEKFKQDVRKIFIHMED